MSVILFGATAVFSIVESSLFGGREAEPPEAAALD